MKKYTANVMQIDTSDTATGVDIVIWSKAKKIESTRTVGQQTLTVHIHQTCHLNQETEYPVGMPKFWQGDTQTYQRKVITLLELNAGLR